jgi:hypothetical protein
VIISIFAVPCLVDNTDAVLVHSPICLPESERFVSNVFAEAVKNLPAARSRFRV